mmetsp:Transcript_36528/g.73640  ORF Transcript_36528/g.73640 Transcript_36528/m.73640 type:complete len:81 (+) Transcript_36528:597-839(+)
MARVTASSTYSPWSVSLTMPLACTDRADAGSHAWKSAFERDVASHAQVMDLACPKDAGIQGRDPIVCETRVHHTLGESLC